MFAEPLGILKRDGRRLPGPGLPAPPPDRPPAGEPESWLKLTVYSGEQSRHAGRPLYFDLVRRLRAAGAPGVTVLRGIRGYHGDHAPHGDQLFSLRRRVPVVTEVIDRPERIAGWFGIIDELTDRTGLVTVEPVPTVVPAPAA